MPEEEKQAVFDALLQEEREFSPQPGFAGRAVVKDDSLYREAGKDYEAFWARHAQELEWFKPWNKVLAWSPPHAGWFVGGKLNISYNCLDRHLLGSRRDKAAIIWEG